MKTDKKYTYSCPTCRKPVTDQDNAQRPFCSERCRLVDLHKWISEEYRIPAEKAEEVVESDTYNEQ